MASVPPGDVEDGRRPSSPSVRPRGTLVCGDNLGLLRRLREEGTEKFDLIYLDPPFATGSGFDARVRVGDCADQVRVPVYRDRWEGGLMGYLEMLRERFTVIRELLSERGSLYVHLDYRSAARVRCLLDDLFGARSFVNEIVWFYKTGGMPEKLGFGRKHDTILFYAKDPRQAIWNPQKEKSYLTHRYGFSNVEVHEDDRGPFTWVNCRDVFDIPALRGNQPERVEFPTQKPESLLERIIRASSVPGSLVGDFWCGSGTTLVASQKLGRRFIGCDVSPFAIHTTRKRLVKLPGCSFDVVGDDEISYHLEAELDGHRQERRVNLTRFAPEAVDPLPATLRGLVRHFGDRIDFWGVSVASRPGDFLWFAERTRRQRLLPLVSDPLGAVEEPLVVTAIDVLGNRAAVTLPGPSRAGM